MGIKFVESRAEGRMGIATPYNAQFVAELKEICPGAKYENVKEPTWYFDEEAKEDVIALADKFFASARKMRVTWELSRDAAVTVDGVDLVTVNRDYAKVRGSDFRAKVIESVLKAGGSRNNPHVSGRLVLELAIRPDALFSPEPESIEELPEQEPYNPLAAVPTADLVAEIARRGEATDAQD